MSEYSSSDDGRQYRKYPADFYYVCSGRPMHWSCANGFASTYSQCEKLPQLHVSRAGVVPMPLSEEVEAKLQQLCEQQGKQVDDETKQTWQLDASLLAITTPEWDQKIYSFAEGASKRLGIIGLSQIEAWPQQITLCSKTGAYQFVSESQAPSDHFATMVVLILPAKTAVEATVKHGDKQETLQCAGDSYSCVGYMAYTKGCNIRLQAARASSYGSMVYHLVQPAHIPLVIKDRAWTLNQLKMIMESHAGRGSGSYRCFYLFRDKYDSNHLDNVQLLDKGHQCMASILQEAEHQGMLDVYLAMITHHSQHEVVHHLDRSVLETTKEMFAETSVSDWRKLDGSNLGWGQQPVSFQPTTGRRNDVLMQCESWLSGLEADKEEAGPPEDLQHRWHGCPVKYTNMYRWKYRIGFVIWPRQKRWLNLCLHGSDVACAALHQLATTYDSLKGTPANGPQQTDKLKACKTDIDALVLAIYDHFYGHWDCCNVPGYDSFGDAADALGLPGINRKIHKYQLQDVALTHASAQDLINASRVVPWPDLCVILAAMTDRTCRCSCHTDYMLDAFEALTLLLDVQEPLVQKHLLQVAIQVAEAIGRANYILSLCKPCEGTNPKKYVAGCKSGKDGLTAQELVRQDPSRAWRLLVVESLKLLQAVQLQACKAKNFNKGLETATFDMVNSYITHPKLFAAATVLGPACLDIAEAQSDSQTAFGSPAGLRLLIGVMRQLQQLAQPTASSAGQDRGTVHNPSQPASISPRTEAEDQLASMQQAKMMLPQLQELFDQAVVTLFMQSGTPPAENHAEVKQAVPKACHQLPLVLYNVWKPAKREKTAQQ